MNQCPPGSQGARGQLSTGLSGPLDFAAVDRKEIFQPNFSYGVFLLHSAMEMSDKMGSGWPRVRGWSGWATDVEGFGECDGEIGIGLSVGRGVRLRSGESCLWVAADLASFF